MKLNKIIMICGTLLLGTVVLSCNDKENYDVDGISHIRAFFDKAGTITDGTVLSTPAGTIVSFSDEVLVKVTSPSSVPTQVSFIIDNSLIADYNDSHDTNYCQLPEGVLKMDKTSLSIPANAYQSNDTLKLSIDQSGAKVLDNVDGYLVPIVISSTNHGSVRPSSNASVRYVRINYNETKSLINDNASEFVGTKAEVTSLSCISATNLNPDEFSNLAEEGWDAQWNFTSDTPEASFTIDLGDTHNVAGFYIDSYVLANAYVEISTDNKSWIELGNTSEHKALIELDYDTYMYKQEFVLYAPIQSRYLRASLTLDSSSWAWKYYRYITSLSIYYKD